MVKNSLGEIANVKKSSLTGIAVSSWKELQALVRAGKASEVVELGDRLVCKRGDTKLTWEVVGFDQDTPVDENFTHSLTLGLCHCLPEFVTFDAGEKLYCCEERLPAGTYHFTVPEELSDLSHGGSKIQFTIDEDLLAGDYISISEQSYSYSMKLYAVHRGQGTESLDFSIGNKGTDLGIADGTSPNLNDFSKGISGFHRWKSSSLRNYLNTDKTIDEYKFNFSDTWLEDTAGFLHGLDDDFLAVIGKVQKTQIVGSYMLNLNYTSKEETTDDLFFIPSLKELGYDVSSIEHSTGDTGKTYQRFQYAYNKGVDSSRLRRKNGVVSPWWTRTTQLYSNDAGCLFAVNVDGAAKRTGFANTNNVTSGGVPYRPGIVPFCCIV